MKAMPTLRISILIFASSICFADGLPERLHSTSSPKVQEPDRRPAPPGTIRVRVRLIPVDVSVADKTGKPVTDLRKEDFVLLENGRPQEIQHFSVQTMTSDESPSAEAPPLRVIPTAELSPQKSRTFLIFLARGRLNRPFGAIDDLIRFVRQDLLPSDRIALFVYNRASDFTTNHELIARALERYKNVNDRIEAQYGILFSGLRALYGSQQIPDALQSEISGILESVGGLASRTVPAGRLTENGSIAQDALVAAGIIHQDEARRSIPSATAGSRPKAEDPSKEADRVQADQSRQDLHEDPSFERFASRWAVMNQDIANLLSAIEYLRYMEGDKHLLLFVEQGLFLPSRTSEDFVAALANQARVAVTSIQTGGMPTQLSLRSEAPMQGQPAKPDLLGSVSGRARSEQTFGQGSSVRGLQQTLSGVWSLTTLRSVSAQTGGQCWIHGWAGEALSAINKSTRVRYLLGYYPNDSVWDGKYRNITVKLNRPGKVTLFYRHGYYAKDQLQPVDRQEFLSYGRVAAAASHPAPPTDLPFKATTTPQKDASGQPQIRIDLTIDASKVGFVLSPDGLQTARVEIAVFYGDSKGAYLGNDWQTLIMNLRETTYQRVMREGIPYSTAIPFPRPKLSLKIVAYDHGNDMLGSLMTTIRRN